MLYIYETLDTQEAAVLERIVQLRRDLKFYVVQEPRRWTGLLARMTRARALRASNSVEGINISAEDAIAVIDNEEPVDADKPTWQAVEGYHTAMDYILQRCKDDTFSFSKDALLAVHFMISQHDLDSNPGNFRRGWVGVHNTSTGELVHEGVDRDKLEPLVDDLVEYLNGDADTPITIKAAMAHLNLTLMHPFSDGNGRTARCIQTAVLAKEGIVAPIFSSIEEYIGRNQQEYYAALAEVGGGGWHPERTAKPWIRFCLTGHYRQALTFLRRMEEIGSVYGELEKLVKSKGLPERTTLGLIEASAGLRVRNASYRVSTGVSLNLASRDLRALVDAGLLIAEGERRGRQYVAADEIKVVRAKYRRPRGILDPFAEAGDVRQGKLMLEK